MLLKNNKILGRDFSSRSGRHSFVLTHYRKGKILDIGNVGGLEGGLGSNYSPYLRLVSDVKESEVFGFDMYRPVHNSEIYKNQSYGDIHDGLPYEDEFFDTVYLGEFIEHIHNPRMVLREVYRVLKKDGVMILDTPNAYDARRILKYLFFRTEDLGDPTHVIMYTPGSLVSLIEKNGFSVSVLSEKVSGLISRIPFVRGLGTTLLIVAKKTDLKH